MASALIIKNADVYAPQSLGIMDIVSINGKIVKGAINFNYKILEDLGIDVEIINAEGSIVTPGFIDPHEHIIGGSGEEGFASRSPEISLNEIVRGGITTVVGCLGVDTYTRNMPSLLAQCKVYNEEGISAFIYTGGYNIPPTTLTGSILTDIILVSEVIGAGEIAISDVRSSKASNREVAKLISEAYNGGILTGKAGVTHLHMGDANSFFDPIHEMIRDHDLNVKSIYPTHVERNEQLLKQGIEATKVGITIDFDVGEDDFIPSLKKFIENNGNLEYLTISSDASFVSPCVVYDQIKSAVKDHNFPLVQVLPLVTTNTARILKLGNKGKIDINADAVFLIIDPSDFRLRYVIAKGAVFIREGKIDHVSKCLVNSTRVIERYGQKKVSR